MALIPPPPHHHPGGAKLAFFTREIPPFEPVVEPTPHSEHDWQPVSFVFESQLLDDAGRVIIRQPRIDAGRVYVVCMACHSHTYVVTKWVGYYLQAPETPGEDEEAGSKPS